MRLLEVGLALAYGLVLGTWIPVPRVEPILALPPAVVTSPIPRQPPSPLPGHAEPTLAGEWVVPSEWLAGGTPGAGELQARVPARAAARWSADTLPGAPHTTVVPFAGPAGAIVRASFHASTGDGPSPYGGRGANGCPAIVEEGAELPPQCRRASQRRLQAMCPPDGARPRSGPVICIRADD